MQQVSKLRAAARQQHAIQVIRHEATVTQLPNVPRPPPGGPVPPPPPEQPRSSHFGKIFVALGTGGAAYYGYQNYDMIKEKMEENLPAPILETLGMAHKRQTSAVEPPKIKSLPSPLVPREEPVIPKLPPTQQTEKKPDAPIRTVEPVDVRASHIGPITSFNTVEANELNKQLESRILAAISSAEKKVKAANDAKVHTIEAIQEHAIKLKKAVDDGANANWDVVSESLINSERFAKSDMNEETHSRNYIDSLRKIINDGKSNPSTANNPLLLNAIETANKLSYQLDELNSLVQKARNESRVLNQYKDLIDKSRQQFSTELKAILPDVDLNAKGKKLSEDEMNALIAHAHLRVDHLRRQLTEQQIREEQNIAKAIEEQRIADSKLAHNQLQLEVQRVKEDQNLEIERGLQTERKNWETELEDRLRRAAQAHSEHLEQVVRTQKQLYDIENAQAVEEAVSKERRLHSKQVDLALSKLSGIETALQSRVAADAENRRAKQYWLACQNLVQSIIHGQKAGMDMDARRKPLDKELEVIQQACEKDEFVQNIMTFFAPDTLSKGVYSEQDLRNRFATVYSLAKRTAKVDENGGGVMAYLSSYIQSMFMLELPRRFSPDDKIDLNHMDNYEIISRAKYFVEQNDFDNAVRIMQLLHGEPARIARDWICDTKEHLASRFLAELLVSHAAVTSIRSTY
uniref:MICOS complex subunit MIC60 n=1 Tax=Panagrolaimus sp. ES5 TaxID=591445 RepID=A0AC34GXD7_9BILA